MQVARAEKQRLLLDLKPILDEISKHHDIVRDWLADHGVCQCLTLSRRIPLSDALSSIATLSPLCEKRDSLLDQIAKADETCGDDDDDDDGDDDDSFGGVIEECAYKTRGLCRFRSCGKNGGPR
jgi:hypothetical protein